MRAMKQSGIPWIVEIPENWFVVPTKQIMRKNKEICDKYNGEDIISLTMQGVIKRDLINPKGKMPSTFDGYQKIYKNNLLLCLFDIDVTPRCAGLICDNGLTSPAYSQFVLNGNAYPPYYAYYLIAIDNEKSYLHLSKNLRSTITEDDFGMIPIIYPPLPEQTTIANFLDNKCSKIDVLIENEEKMILELSDYKNQLAVHYTTKGLNKTKLKQSNVDWIGEIPEHWQILPLYAIFREHKSKNTGMKENNLLSLSYGNIIRKNINTDEGLLPENFEGYNIVKQGDIVLRLTDMQNDQRSLRTGLVREQGIITSAYVTIRNYINANSEYLRYLLHSADICKIIYNFGFGIRQNLKFSELKRMDLILPPRNEQDEIVTFLNKKFLEVDSLITTKKQKITELKDYKKSLIYEYVTGKKEPV